LTVGTGFFLRATTLLAFVALSRWLLGKVVEVILARRAFLRL
jgi:hypothetical protein